MLTTYSRLTIPLTYSWLSRGMLVSTSTECARLSCGGSMLSPGRLRTAPPPPPPPPPAPSPPPLLLPSERVNRGFSESRGGKGSGPKNIYPTENGQHSPVVLKKLPHPTSPRLLCMQYTALPSVYLYNCPQSRRGEVG